MQADYKAALIEEYEGYARGGRSDEADEVAAELKLVFGWTPGKAEKTTKAEKPEPEPAVERAVPDKDEAETPEKSEAPVRRGPGRPRKNPE
jgi:hypothetical protein